MPSVIMESQSCCQSRYWERQLDNVFVAPLYPPTPAVSFPSWGKYNSRLSGEGNPLPPPLPLVDSFAFCHIISANSRYHPATPPPPLLTKNGKLLKLSRLQLIFDDLHNLLPIWMAMCAHCVMGWGWGCWGESDDITRLPSVVDCGCPDWGGGGDDCKPTAVVLVTRLPLSFRCFCPRGEQVTATA